MSSDEEDHQFDSVLGEDDYGDFDDSFESSEEDQDEMIDYEGMKSALELIRQVRTWFYFDSSIILTLSHFLL